HDLVARDVRLRVALELFYLDHAAIELRVTEHEANRRTEVARAPQQALERAAARIELHDHAATPQIPREREALEHRTLTDRGDETASRARHLRVTEREQQPLDAQREADGRQVRATEGFEHPIVPATADQRVLRAELPLRRLDFEQRARVIVETAHEPRVHPVGDSERLEGAAEPFEVGAVVTLEHVEDRRGVGDDGAVAWILRIQNSQRVVAQATLGVLAQLAAPRLEVGEQRLAVAGARRRAAQRIHGHVELLEDEPRQELDEHSDHLGIDDRTSVAVQLTAGLVELPVTASLRLFRAEHRPDVVPARHGLARMLVCADERTSCTRSALWSQREPRAAAFELEHLLFDDFARLPRGAHERPGRLAH